MQQVSGREEEDGKGEGVGEEEGAVGWDSSSPRLCLFLCCCGFLSDDGGVCAGEGVGVPDPGVGGGEGEADGFGFGGFGDGGGVFVGHHRRRRRGGLVGGGVEGARTYTYTWG